MVYFATLPVTHSKRITMEKVRFLPLIPGCCICSLCRRSPAVDNSLRPPEERSVVKNDGCGSYEFRGKVEEKNKNILNPLSFKSISKKSFTNGGWKREKKNRFIHHLFLLQRLHTVASIHVLQKEEQAVYSFIQRNDLESP